MAIKQIEENIINQEIEKSNGFINYEEDNFHAGRLSAIKEIQSHLTDVPDVRGLVIEAWNDGYNKGYNEQEANADSAKRKVASRESFLRSKKIIE